MPEYLLYGRWAESPTVIIEADNFDDATEQAAELARQDRVSPGYLPQGSLCPMEREDYDVQ